MFAGELEAVLESQSAQATRSYAVSVGLEDLVEKRLLVELDREVVVRLGLARTLRPCVPTHHGPRCRKVIPLCSGLRSQPKSKMG